MAQLIGTGKDPRYVTGQPFDVPDAQAGLIEELITTGAAVYPVPGGDPQRVVEIANGVVRGDALTLPEDKKIAKEIEGKGKDGGRAHDIVHTGDPKAKKGAHEIDEDEAAERAHKVEPVAAPVGPDVKDAEGHKESPEKTPTPRG